MCADIVINKEKYSPAIDAYRKVCKYMASKLGSSPSELPPLLKQKLDNLTDSTLSDVKRVATLSGVLYFVTTVAHPKKEELETNHLVFTCLPSFLIISTCFHTWVWGEILFVVVVVIANPGMNGHFAHRLCLLQQRNAYWHGSMSFGRQRCHNFDLLVQPLPRLCPMGNKYSLDAPFFPNKRFVLITSCVSKDWGVGQCRLLIMPLTANWGRLCVRKLRRPRRLRLARPKRPHHPKSKRRPSRAQFTIFGFGFPTESVDGFSNLQGISCALATAKW